MQIPPFNDVRVRKAFTMVGSRQEMADKITQAGQIPASALTPAFAGYVPPVGYKENEEQAKKLLADAGYPGGKGFPTVKLLYNTSSTHKKIAEYWQQRFEQVLGVKIEIVNQEWATYLESRKDGKMGGFHLARAGWIADYQDPYNFLFMFKKDNIDFNDTRWDNPKYNELVAEGEPAARRRRAQQDVRRGREDPDRGRRGHHADLLLRLAEHDRLDQVGRVERQPPRLAQLQIHLQEITG